MARETCARTTVWPEVRPYGVRLSCCLPAGHAGDCACADVEYLPKPEDT
jgi:hypothetical protein